MANLVRQTWRVLGVDKVRVPCKEWKRRVQDPLRPKVRTEVAASK